MRIGVHTVNSNDNSLILFNWVVIVFFQGKIIGGVIGTDIVRYDIYGKDVVIANKMESSGE